jgi:hypothetical protein
MTTSTAPAAPADPFAAGGLDASVVLDRVAEAEAAERRAGLSKLELALAWCALHPATAESGSAVWADAGLPGISEWEEGLGGDGCPLIAAFAPEPFAAALGTSTMAGMQLLADALDLAHRLPKTWARVQRLAVTPWKARRLAQATHRLHREAARYVDDQLAHRIDSCGAVLIDRTVAQAAARFEPADQEVAEVTRQAGWDVHLSHATGVDAAVGIDGFVGTSYLQACGDTLDLTKLYDLVCDHAAHLARLGDTDPEPARRRLSAGSPTNSPSSTSSALLPSPRPPPSGGPAWPRPGCTSTSRPPTWTRWTPARRTSRSGRSSGSVRPPWPRSSAGWPAPGPPSSRSSTWPVTTPSTNTIPRRGCARP